MNFTCNTRPLRRSLREIHATWHFWSAVSFGGESDLRKAGVGDIHPLTRSYKLSLVVGLEN
ncbi:DUF3265 domain-containing protein [Vibrio parahaemolyticus]|nr:DUF3265 domain-containing protein [Vibrio parahaemolyticus]EJE8774781.1 DUF3265 domain-containing protein [Vibrio parahaemolyticus]ELA9194692.1 DUF3265 domain-containing protein [Vibrio parahaemolyticus]